MRAHRVPAVLAAALALPFLAACGGDDEPLPRAELITKADAVCKDFRSGIAKLDTPKRIGQYETYADESKKLLDKQVDKLKDLTPPKEVASDWDAYVDVVEGQEDTLTKISDAAKKGDEKGIEEVAATARKASRSGGRRAQAVGLKVCGQEA